MIVLSILTDLLICRSLFSSAFEFIFAQSPYSMRSMLVGTFYTIQGLFAMVPLIIQIIVAYGYDMLGHSAIGCNSIFFLIIIIFGIIGLFLYATIALKYKRRLRDEHIDQYIIVENYYTSLEVQMHKCCI